MHNEAQIRDMFARMNTELATYHPLFGQWSANSQYGYTMEWCETKEIAEQYVIRYYIDRMNLILQ